MRFSLFPLLLLPSLAVADVAYTLTPEPTNKSVRVSMVLDAPAGKVNFRIPGWCPGFYFMQAYQHKISSVQVTASGKSLPLLSDTDTRLWSVENPQKGPVMISYRVAGDDRGMGFFGVSVYPHTAFVNGPAAFMYADGFKEEPATLTIKNPEGWQAATAMDSKNGVFLAGDYDELIDHPLRLGKFQRRTFVAEGVPFEVVYASRDNTFSANLDEETARIKALSVPLMKFWAGRVPFKRYVYLFNLGIGGFSGGLEHRASSVISIPNSVEFGVDDLVVHELFHTWNVKHIRPKVLGPFDYTQPVRTENLWFAEGVTDYYAKLYTYASGLHGQDYLFTSLAQEIDTLQAGVSRLDHSLAKASMQAWEGSSIGIGDLSFYNKGLVAGLVLDAAIRSRTAGQKSLDDVMRFMYDKYKLPKPGFEEDGVLKAINQVTGHDFSALYNRIVRSTEELPYEVLKGIGMRVILPGETYYHFGFDVQQGRVVTPQLKAEELGIRAGDQIVSVDGKPYRPNLRGFDPRGYTLHVLRNGFDIRLNMRAIPFQANQVIFERDPWASPEAAALGDKWLEGPRSFK